MPWLFPLLFIIYTIIKENKANDPNADGFFEIFAALIFLILMVWFAFS